MAKFVKFTNDRTGSKYFINIDLLTAIVIDKDGMMVLCTDNTEFTVKETREEVMRLLGIKEATK